MNRSFTLSRSIEVHHWLLEISDLVPKPIILSRLELKLLLNILHPLIHLPEPQFIHLNIISLLFILFPQFLYLSLSHVNFILIGLHLGFALLEHLSLVICYVVKLLTHLSYLLGLSVVDVWLSGYLLLARLDVRLGILVLRGQHLVVLAGFGELDLDVP